MYSKIREEEDNQMAERWQKDADEIVIFVSPDVASIHNPQLCNLTGPKAKNRPVCSLPSSQQLSSYPFKT